MRVSVAVGICLMVICTAFRVTAADEVPQWRALTQAAQASVETKDYAKLRETLLALKPLVPGNPRNAYNLAAAEAVLGNRAAALAGLRSLAGMGLVYNLAADDDFASLLSIPEFISILAQMETNKKPVAQASPVFAIPEKDLIPEDLAYDPKTRRFFVSSVRNAQIMTMDGKTFAKAPWSVLALQADPRHRTLWASTAWVPHCESCVKTDEDKTALLAFDLDSAVLKQRIESPVPGLLGDMTISRGGDIYVSEGIHGAVFRLAQGSATLERLDHSGEFPSPQTPALSADERTLYVPDYVRGIAAIDLTNTRHPVRWLQPADNIALSGIDGLYIYHRSFLAVQNGTNPARVIRFSADLQHQEILEANTPGLGEPTHGIVVKEFFYFLANTGWSQYDGKGKKKAGTTPVESSVRRVRLSR